MNEIILIFKLHVSKKHNSVDSSSGKFSYDDSQLTICDEKNATLILIFFSDSKGCCYSLLKNNLSCIMFIRIMHTFPLQNEDCQTFQQYIRSQYK